MKSQYYTYIGCDVSKAKIDICIDKKKHFIVKNEHSGFTELFDKLTGIETPMLVLEHTGIYSEALCEAAQDAGIAFACVNPTRVRDFAKSEGAFAKTDKIDAEIIRRFGEEKHPRPQQAVTKEHKELRELRNATCILKKANVMLKTELESVQNRNIRNSIQKMIAANDKQIANFEARCLELLRANPKTKAVLESILEVRGIGEKTAIALLISLPELGRLSRNKIASLVGVAPQNKQSGTVEKKRFCLRGRAQPRTALYMASFSAIKDPNAHLGAFYATLRARNKPFKVAITACMRKLIIHLNSIARDALK